MLFALKLNVPSKRGFILLLGVVLIPSVKGESCSQDQDLSWVKKLNGHAQSLSDAPHKDALLEEAEWIVQNALKSASETKNCSQARALVRHGETGIRQTLKSPLLGGALSTRDLNGHSKALSDSRVTETGVNDALPYPKLLVFVSFSMPAESLKALNSQARQLGGKLVVRGLIKGRFQETAQKLKELQIDVIIDPTLFEAYQIKSGKVLQSPTFILRNTPTESAEEEVAFDRMTGNVSLDYVLEQFSTSGETRHDAFEMLKTLRRKP